jgi:MFS family permease
MANLFSLRSLSFAVVGLVTFVGDCARGILFPALWPLCQYAGGSRVDLGYLVAVFSIGRLLVSTPVGWIADKYRHRASLIFSSVILVLGALVWGNVLVLGGLPILYVAQFVLGLGTGSLGVTRSYVVEQTEPQKRTHRLSKLSALQYAGFAATPLVGSALFVSGASISQSWKYQLPAYFLLFLAVACLVLVIYPFVDIEELKRREHQALPQYEQEVEPPQPIMNPLLDNVNIPDQLPDNEEEHDQNDDETYEPEDIAGTSDAIIRRSVSKSVDNNRSRTTSLFHDVEPNEEKKDSNSPFNGVSYVQAIATTNTDSHGHETKSLIAVGGDNSSLPQQDPALIRIRSHIFLLMILLNFTTRGGIAVYETQISATLLDTYNLSELQLGFLVSMAGLIGTVQLLFFKQFWTNRFTDYQLMVGGIMATWAAEFLVINFGPDNKRSVMYTLAAMFVVYGFGYPISNSAVLGCFSKLQKSGRQGTAQSQFALMGSASRVVIPILSGYMEQYLEGTSSFGMVALLMMISLCGVVLYQRPIQYFTQDEVAAASEEGGWLSFMQNNERLTISQWSTVLITIATSAVVIGSMFDWGVPAW